MYKDRAITDQQKRQMLEQLLQEWKSCPHERLGQFLTNAARELDVFYVEDFELLRRAKARNEATREARQALDQASSQVPHHHDPQPPE